MAPSVTRHRDPTGSERVPQEDTRQDEDQQSEGTYQKQEQDRQDDDHYGAE